MSRKDICYRLQKFIACNRYPRYSNGGGESVVNQGETYTKRFAEKLAFSMFYNFIRVHKEYVFHKNIRDIV